MKLLLAFTLLLVTVAQIYLVSSLHRRLSTAASRAHEFPPLTWPQGPENMRRVTVHDHPEQRYEIQASDGGAILRFNYPGHHWALLPASPGNGFSVDVWNYGDFPLELSHTLPVALKAGHYTLAQMRWTVVGQCTFIFDGTTYQPSACQQGSELSQSEADVRLVSIPPGTGVPPGSPRRTWRGRDRCCREARKTQGEER